MQFNEIIKLAMRNQSISGYRMSIDLKINQGQLCRFLKNNDQLSTRNLQKIFDYLKISLKAA